MSLPHPISCTVEPLRWCCISCPTVHHSRPFQVLSDFSSTDVFHNRGRLNRPIGLWSEDFRGRRRCRRTCGRVHFQRHGKFFVEVGHANPAGRFETGLNSLQSSRPKNVGRSLTRWSTRDLKGRGRVGSRSVRGHVEGTGSRAGRLGGLWAGGNRRDRPRSRPCL